MFLGPRGSLNARKVPLDFVPQTGSVSSFIMMRPLEASPLLITHLLDTKHRRTSSQILPAEGGVREEEIEQLCLSHLILDFEFHQKKICYHYSQKRCTEISQ